MGQTLHIVLFAKYLIIAHDVIDDIRKDIVSQKHRKTSDCVQSGPL